MKKLLPIIHLLFSGLFLWTLAACNGKKKVPAGEAVSAIALKRGTVVLCGPPGQQFGSVVFESSFCHKVKKDFELAIALLHSFEYDEAEKVFAGIIDAEPECAIAWWGVAMCNFHPLWAPPTQAELEKGSKAVLAAQAIQPRSRKESAYIDAIASFYKDWNTIDHRTRALHFEKAMEKIHTEHPSDKEAAIFYALALNGAADPADKSYSRQKKAGSILTGLYPNEPNHPGIIHYIIHSYDYPELAAQALPAARKYASVAPSSAHAQHMPSHIFTRLGLWDECIHSNLASTDAARCYADKTDIKGHWDEELHGMDYLVYAYLQKADNRLAKEQWDYLASIQDVYPANFKVAYAFAAIPARYVLENKMWATAATLKIHPTHFPWEKFPWQKAIIHFTRLLGAVHIDRMDSATTELEKLHVIHNTLMQQKDSYKANQVQIQIKTGEAWIQFKKGNKEKALELMDAAASMEDNTQKHPVTPGEVIPARELLGDLLLEMNKPQEALATYEAGLKGHPNRFNGLYGAGSAAERAGDPVKATFYYQQLINIGNAVHSNRPELPIAQLFLQNQQH